jgi:acetyl esterase/lipase
MNVSSVRDKIAALGKAMDDDVVAQTVALYAGLLRTKPPAPCTVRKDIPYGGHARQRLDVYAPAAAASAPLPIVVYIHGGGFVGGNKNLVADTVYANVGHFFAANDIAVVTANFRLPPESVWPAATDDISAVLQWVADNAASFGGDAGNVVLFGHSSGASHVATFALHGGITPRFRGTCAGIILASGRYELTPVNPDPRLIDNFGRAKIAQYYGDDAHLYKQRQVLGNVITASVPAFLVLAELDTFVFEKNTVGLLWELMQVQGRMPWFRQIAGHNHMSEVLHLGTEDQSLGPHLVRFVRACSGRRD